jgi:hypothetical protein
MSDDEPKNERPEGDINDPKSEDLDTGKDDEPQVSEQEPKLEAENKPTKQQKSREFSSQNDARVTQQDRKAALLRDKAKKIEQDRMKATLAADDFDNLDNEVEVVTTPEERGAKLRKARADRKKFLIKAVGGSIGFLILFYFGYMLFKPFTLDVDSGRKYTICKTFIQIKTKYPDTLKYSRVKFKTGNSVDVLYSQIDPFGQYRMDSMRCYFREVKESEVIQYGQIGAYAVDKIEYNNGLIPDESLNSLNKSVMPVLLGEIDYDYPRGFSDALMDLYFESDSFFKIQL